MGFQIPKIKAYPGVITAGWAQKNLERIRNGKVIRIPTMLRKGASQAEYDRINLVFKWAANYGYTKGDGFYDKWASVATYYPPHFGQWARGNY